MVKISMIVVSKKFKEWANEFGSQDAVAKELGITRIWVNMALNGAGVGAKFVEAVTEKTDFTFGEAFTVVEDDREDG